MNAKKELLDLLEEVGTDIKCASIPHYDRYRLSSPDRVVRLKVGYTPEEWHEFLSALDFDYDDGFGGQELFGTIWFTDGTYATRGEYDGSEWWEHHECPEIPDTLL
jgi:hypothetical protein